MTTASLPPRAAPRPLWLTGIRADVLALAVLCAGLVPALAPLAASGVPATHDGYLHIQRVVALDQLARDGASVGRWVPSLAYGYGQPVFNYYAPLAYGPALLAQLAGLDAATGFELATAAWLIGSAFAMYLLARALWGPVAALTAALVYAYLPYQLVDVYVRGALAETAAFVWLPVIAWCLLMARRDGRGRWPAGLALCVAGLVLTHNVTALIAAPAFAVLALALWLQRRPGGRALLAPSWKHPALGAVVGLLLAAWFWLPAIAERDLVQIGETIEPELFASFFIRQWPPFGLDLAFDYVEPVSTALGSPIYWPQLGLVQLAVTLGGVLALRWTRGPARSVLVWATGLALATFLLQLGPAEPLFRAVPLASFVQFPWRLLALLGFASALLAAGLVGAVGRTPGIRVLVGCIIVGASIVTAVWRLDPLPTYPDARYLSVDGILRSELADYALGTTHSGEYLPASSGIRNSARFRKELLEDPPQQSAPRQAAPRPPARFRVEGLQWRPGAVSFRVVAPEPDRVLIHQFAFPGWSARVGGVDAPIAVDGRFGLLAVDVPAGSTTVELRWGWTPIRVVGLGLSLVGVFGLLLVAGWSPRRSLLVAVPLGAVAAFAGFAYLLTGTPTGAPEAAPEAAPEMAEAPRWQPVDERLALVRADLDRSRLQRDGVVIASLDWLALDRLPPGYSASVVVEGPNGAAHRAGWAHDGLAPRWERGEIVPTTLAVRLPPSLPSGEATLALLVERPGAASGEPALRVELGTARVPVHAANPASSPAARRGTPVVAGLTLIDRRLVTASGRWHAVRPGDWLDADLTLGAASADLAQTDLYGVLVLRAGDREVASDTQRIGDWFQPLPFWQAGDTWRQRIRLVTPRSLAAGDYEAALRLYGRELAPGGLAAPGAASWRPRGRPVAELELGTVTVVR